VRRPQEPTVLPSWAGVAIAGDVLKLVGHGGPSDFFLVSRVGRIGPCVSLTQGRSLQVPPRPRSRKPRLNSGGIPHPHLRRSQRT